MTTLVAREALVDYIGKETTGQRWLTIDQKMIDAFADLTGDHQYIHVDPLRAKDTPFGTTIAHGFLTLSLITPLCTEIRYEPKGKIMGINYGFDKIRFLEPVRTDASIRARVKLLSVLERNPSQILTKSEVTIDIRDNQKPALVAEWLGMFVMPEY